MMNKHGRYIHSWHVPIKVKVYGVTENWYYAPHFNPKLLPATEFDNCLAMPYEHVMPVLKAELLKGRQR